MEVESPRRTLANGSNGSTPLMRPGAKRTHTGELAKSAQSPVSPTVHQHNALSLISQVLRVSITVSLYSLSLQSEEQVCVCVCVCVA